jgi:hypothetical protein
MYAEMRLLKSIVAKIIVVEIYLNLGVVEPQKSVV